MKTILLTAAALAALLTTGAWRAPDAAVSGTKVCEECVRAHMQTLAGPAMNGRRCSTQDEARAADYLVSEFKRLGVRGALAHGAYLQSVPLETSRLAASPEVVIDAPAGRLTWIQGKAMITSATHAVSGPLVRVTDLTRLPRTLKGAVVFYDPGEGAAPVAPGALEKAGAVGELSPARPAMAARFAMMAAGGQRPQVADPAARTPEASFAQVLLSADAAAALRGMADGTPIRLEVQALPSERSTTQNVLAVIHGWAPDADRRAILLSAHYDHLGLRDGKLYPGANDDASGTSAVLEFARLLESGARPKRTVYFGLFGCEEAGELGAEYFRNHLPMPIADLSANIEFEMIGYRDPKRPDTLMLTGWDRTNLGPTLVAHGAKLGDDPYPEQHFFQRSDNYQLALKGVVAQTTSGWPLPPTYHQPDDDLDHVDIPFMASAIQSMVGPVRWLLDGDFKPEWLPGKKP